MKMGSDKPRPEIAPVDHERFVGEIDSALSSGQFEFARDTLEGIKEGCERFQSVTVNQYSAVEKILQSRDWSLDC